MDKATATITGIVVGVLTLAIIAVLVSQKANTANVIGSSGSALANIISAAVSPITGNSVSPNVGSGNYGAGGGGGFFGGGGGGGDPISGLLRGFGGLNFSPSTAMGLASSFGAGML